MPTDPQRAALQDARRLDALTESFARELTNVLRVLETRVRRLVRTMDTERGRLVSTRSNLGRAVRARNEIASAVRAAGYGRLVDKALDKPLEELAARVIQRAPEALAALTDEGPAFVTDSLGAFKQLRLDQLMGLEPEIATGLWRLTLDGVVGASPVDDLVAQLSEFADVSLRQARVLYDTAVSTYMRQVEATLAEGTPDELFMYLGPADLLTREFCLEHVGKVYTREEIDDLDNGIKGYGDVFLSGGGPNCRHQWRRVPPDSEWADLHESGERLDSVQEDLDAVREQERARSRERAA